MSGLALTQPFGVGVGVQEPFKVDDPAAGAVWSFPCDGHGWRRLVSLVFTLTTAVAAANRGVTVEWVGGDTKSYAVAGFNAVVVASTTQRCIGALGYSNGAPAAGTPGFFPLPAVFLAPGDSLQLVVANIQAADQVSSIRGVMERFPLDGQGVPASWFAEAE